MELLKILVCAPNRRASKDELIQSIWPNNSMINASHTLDSAASILRRHILQNHAEESLLQTILKQWRYSFEASSPGLSLGRC